MSTESLLDSKLLLYTRQRAQMNGENDDELLLGICFPVVTLLRVYIDGSFRAVVPWNYVLDVTNSQFPAGSLIKPLSYTFCL